MIMRELTGGLYFGEKDRRSKCNDSTGFSSYIMKKRLDELQNMVDIVMKRRKKVTSVDKANVLDSFQIMGKSSRRSSKDYPEVTVENMLVDNCATPYKRSKQFDVILTENMFGDILFR